MTYLYREQWLCWCVQLPNRRHVSMCRWPGLVSATAPKIPRGGRPCRQCQREMAWASGRVTRDIRRGAAA